MNEEARRCNAEPVDTGRSCIKFAVYPQYVRMIFLAQTGFGSAPFVPRVRLTP
jgi:hypothetical protein